MVEISEIVDSESLMAWLREQPDTKAASAIIAHRAAMRVLPIAWRWFVDPAQTSDSTAIPILRASLTSGVVCFAATPEVRAAAAGAAGAAGATARAGIAAASAAFAAYAAYAAYAAARDADDVSTAFAARAVDASYGAASDAASYAADAVWDMIRNDGAKFLNKVDLMSERLRPAPDVDFNDHWLSFKADLKTRSTGSEVIAKGEPALDWSFWIDWYEHALNGTETRWKMLEEIALIENGVWTGDPSDLMDEIYAIVGRYEGKQSAADQSEGLIQVFRATLFDFSYDHAEAVMRAVPLDRDWKHLDDPDLLASFLHDAEDLRDDLELFCDALQSEGTAMQGAGIVRTYCAAILKELARASEHQSLRVGKLMQYGRMIENARLDPSTQAEFGLLAPALQDNGQAVLDLMRNHFARTLSRFAELRDIGIEEDASQWEVLQGFRDLVTAVQTGDGANRPALAREDAAVLHDILESVDRQMRALDGTKDEGAMASLKREINFELAKLGATIAIYCERAVGAEPDVGKAADLTLKWEKRGLGLMGVLTKLKDLL